MERKEGVKMEALLGINSSDQYMVNNFSFQSIYDLSSNSTTEEEEEEKIRSLGFMDLLGVQDWINPPLLEIMAATPNIIPSSCTKIMESPPEVFNQPATPNSSTISSASSEVAVDDHHEPVKEDHEQEEDQQKTKKQLKPKKTNQKRQKREPRFAFMTKSEVDHLEDGYRWRKYGQKAVKNSPFPRSYYRCTTASCNVKKRVERSFNDPTIVVTTYEGQHTHPSPISPCPSFGGSIPSAAFGMPMTQSHYLQNHHHHQQQPLITPNSLSPLSFGHNNGSIMRFCTTRPGPGPSSLKDHGLLQDIVPSHMLKEE